MLVRAMTLNGSIMERKDADRWAKERAAGLTEIGYRT